MSQTLECAFNPQRFNFSKVSFDYVLKEINKLGNRKAIQNTDIPVKILKQNVDISGSYICNLFNVCVDKGKFPSVLKHANITHANITSYEELLTKDGSVRILQN